MAYDNILTRCRERMQDWATESKADGLEYARGEALGYVHGMLYVLGQYDGEAEALLQKEWDDFFTATHEKIKLKNKELSNA